jgi:hypothetical protein
MIRPLAIATFVVALAACGGADSTSKPATTAKMSSSPDDNHALCVSFFQRQRECPEFIPTLVAKRVELDKPAGIAAEDAANGRDALIAKANEEFKTDSTDEAIGQMCDKILATPPAATDIEQGKACMDQSDCQAFSTCAVDLSSRHWQ